MPYAIKKPDGTEHECRLEDIIAGVAAGDLRGDWLVRRIGGDAWMSIETLLQIRDDGRRLVASDAAPVPELPLPSPEAQPLPPALPPDASPIILQPRISKVGGWLIVLILWFAFWIPAGVQGDTVTMAKFFAPVIDQYPALRRPWTICTLLIWSAAIVSVYCAYVLAFRKPAAVVVARRGLVVIAVLQLSLNGVLLLLAQPALRDIPFGLLVKPLVWLAIWYPYLVRSKRVRATYVA